MRIGLIAMSGIRVCDPDLLALGLTLPGVLQRGQVIASLPSLGLLTIAGLTPEGHEISYHEVQDLKQSETLPDDFDLVAISSLTPQIFEAYELADRFRANGTLVVMGGLHVTSLPDEAQAHCDGVVVGEGELFWPQVVDDANRGELRPRYVNRRESFDLACSPMPRFDLLDPHRYNRITVQSSRGCPLQCEFCAGSILLTSKYKQKPVERLLAEIDKILTIWRRPFVELADDNSFCNRRYWRQLLPELAKRKIRWFTETDISVGMDDELLQMMREAGCVEVLIGLESPDRESLAGIELKSNWKQRHWQDHIQAVRNIQQHGIAVNGCFIVGLDQHHPDIFDRIVTAANELELFDVQVTILTPFPGTPLYQRLLGQGRILEPGNWAKCTLFDVNFTPQHMCPDELRLGFHQLVSRLYHPDATRGRRENFQRQFFTPSSQNLAS